MIKQTDKDKHPWDDNLPENKRYIKKFYKKSEKAIEEQRREGDSKGK